MPAAIDVNDYMLLVSDSVAQDFSSVFVPLQFDCWLAFAAAVFAVDKCVNEVKILSKAFSFKQTLLPLHATVLLTRQLIAFVNGVRNCDYSIFNMLRLLLPGGSPPSHRPRSCALVVLIVAGC